MPFALTLQNEMLLAQKQSHTKENHDIVSFYSEIRVFGIT